MAGAPCEPVGGRSRHRWGSQAAVWGAGALAAVVVLGPALAPGALFLLDADFLAHYPVPSGVWGLGPAVPRRVPVALPLAWASSVMDGTVAAKVLLGALLIVAFAGAARLVRSLALPARLGAGALYSLSPFVLTRLGAGQWNVVAAFAVLPWAIGSLLAPGERPARTFGWALAMGATGSVGGLFAALAVAVGLVAERDRAALRGTVLAGIAQLVWLVPGLVVLLGGGIHPVGSIAFPTQAHGVVGILGLVGGYGFWRPASQVGGQPGPGVAVLGAVIAGLAVLGAPRLPACWRWRAVVLASVGVALTLASALPGIRGAFADLTSTVVGAPFRDSQRFMALVLVWLAPAAAGGAQRLAGEPGAAGGRLVGAALGVSPLLIGLALAAPGLWGVGGELTPVQVPGSWSSARAEVQRAPGPVLVLPFDYHLGLPIAGGREVLNPLPDELGGDVISSTDLGSDAPLPGGTGSGGSRSGRSGSAAPGPSPGTESNDPRVPRIIRILAAARGARPVAAALRASGVRWVALLHAADWRAYASLAADPGLVQAVHGADLQLFEVRDWSGPVTDVSGRAVTMHAIIGPLATLAPSGPALWSAPGALGWMRGTSPAGVSEHGLVSLPAGSGILWYWPALVVLGVDAGLVVLAAAMWRPSRSAGPGPVPSMAPIDALPRP